MHTNVWVYIKIVSLYVMQAHGKLQRAVTLIWEHESTIPTINGLVLICHVCSWPVPPRITSFLSLVCTNMLISMLASLALYNK